MKDLQRNKLDFKGQNIYIGIDVHLKSWSVALLSEHSVLKRFSQNPDAEVLYKFLVANYPGASYYSVYEAGFCGFWIHEKLMRLGINNIVVNPADVPTMGKAVFHRIYIGFSLAIKTVSVIQKERRKPPLKVALLSTVRVSIADRLLPSRACFLLTP